MPRILPTILIAIMALTSCTKDPVEVVVPESTITYSVADTMQLAPIVITNFPDLYNNYHNKTYSFETNKVKSNYKVEGADFLIVFEDTSVSNLGTELILKIPNRTILNISGNYSAPTHDLFYKWKQRLLSSSSIHSVDYAKADNFNIQITYDDKTKTLSGTITKLKYPFGIYVPFYQPGSAVTPKFSDEVFLTSGGSFRQHTITFQYAKSL